MSTDGRMGRMEVMGAIARLLVGGLFVAASVHKIVDPEAFAKSIYNYQLVPGGLVNALAILLPWIEFIAGLALIVAPPLRAGAAALIFLLLAAFTVGIASALARGIDISCGCFTSRPDASHMGWLSLVRNTALLVLTIVAARPRGGRAAKVTRSRDLEISRQSRDG